MRLIVTVFLSVFAAVVPGWAVTQSATADTTAANEVSKWWSGGLGDAEYGRFGFRFKVSFLKIDICDIEALVGADEAAALGGVVREGKAKRERIDRAAAIVIAADTVAFKFVFLRDGGIERFLEGTGNNLEAAVDDGIIDEPEYETVWPVLQNDMDAVSERGTRKGDQMMYRVQNGGVRVVYLGIDGDVLIDETHSEKGWASAVKGIFLAEDSSFRDKLIRSLWNE